MSIFFCIALPYPLPGSSLLCNCYVSVGSSHFNKMEFPKEGNSIIRKFPITSVIIPQEISSLSTTRWSFHILCINENQLYLLGTLKVISQRRKEKSPKVLQLLIVVLGLLITFIQLYVFKTFSIDMSFLLGMVLKKVIQSGKQQCLTLVTIRSCCGHFTKNTKM